MALRRLLSESPANRDPTATPACLRSATDPIARPRATSIAAHARAPAVRSDRVLRSAPSPSAGTGSCICSRSRSCSCSARRRSTAARRVGSRRDLDDLLFYGMLGTIVGGRLGYVLFYKAGFYAAHPLDLLKVWEGGMSFHGGLIGVIVGMALFARARGFTFWEVADFGAPLVPTGLAAGRIGNFINGELWGRADRRAVGDGVPADGPPAAAPPVAALRVRLRGPAAHPRLVVRAQKPRPLGAVSGVFLIGYGVRVRRRSSPRAGRLPRPARARHVDGPVAVRADDRRRHRPLAVGARASSRERPGPRARCGRAACVDDAADLPRHRLTGLSPKRGDRIVRSAASRSSIGA